LHQYEGNVRKDVPNGEDCLNDIKTQKWNIKDDNYAKKMQYAGLIAASNRAKKPNCESERITVVPLNNHNKWL